MPEKQAWIEITLDDAYHRELHEEWIAALGRGWRIDRILTRVFTAGALVLAIGGLATGRYELAGVASFLLAIAAFETWKRRRRLGEWLAFVKELPWYGRTMTIEVRAGELVQVKDFEGDPRYLRTEEILPTPSGWLVRYLAPAGIQVSSDAISPSTASVYLPHRAIQPTMTRDAFARLIAQRDH